MTTTMTATDEAAERAAQLRELSRIAAIDAYRYAVDNAGMFAADPEVRHLGRDAALLTWLRGYLLDRAADDDPAGIVARVRGVAEGLAEVTE
jgi:hypothetical protein